MPINKYVTNLLIAKGFRSLENDELFCYIRDGEPKYVFYFIPDDNFWIMIRAQDGVSRRTNFRPWMALVAAAVLPPEEPAPLGVRLIALILFCVFTWMFISAVAQHGLVGAFFHGQY